MMDLQLVAFLGVLGWLTFSITKSKYKTAAVIVGGFIVFRLIISKEQFDSEWSRVHTKDTDTYPIGKSPTKQGYYAGHPYNAPHAAHPFIHPPYLLRNAGKEGFAFGGDLTLTNMYRRLHNLDAVQRTEVFQFNDALAGGHYGIAREPYIGEAYDRSMMDLKQQIRDDIAKKRRPYSEAYDVPTKPLMGDFGQCHMGDCQWEADSVGAILGVPSQVGTRHAYY